MERVLPVSWFGVSFSNSSSFDQISHHFALFITVAMLKNSLLDATCTDLEEDICSFAGGESCCLRQCLDETQAMTACIHMVKTTKDLSTCKQISTCPIIDSPFTIGTTRSANNDKDGSKEAAEAIEEMSGASSWYLSVTGLVAIAAALLA